MVFSVVNGTSLLNGWLDTLGALECRVWVASCLASWNQHAVVFSVVNGTTLLNGWLHTLGALECKVWVASWLVGWLESACSGVQCVECGWLVGWNQCAMECSMCGCVCLVGWLESACSGVQSMCGWLIGISVQWSSVCACG